MDTAKAQAMPESVGMLDDERLTTAFKALAHPARLAILRTIRPRERPCCGEIVKALPLAQSTVSQHLQILRDAGLVKGEIDGRRSCYCIDAAMVDQLATATAALFEDLRQVAEKCVSAPAVSDACCAQADNQESHA